MLGTMIVEYPVPLDAHWVLKRIQKLIPSALIAGGCLRDAINNRPINDIDVFVPEGSERLASFAIGDTHPQLTKSIPEPYFTFNIDVRSVSYFEGQGIPVNIIGVTKGTCTPEQQLERFDFGICRVAWDGVRLWKDITFDRDQRDETFSLMVYQTPEQRKYSMERFQRLQGKYAGWKLVDRFPRPDVFDL